MSKPFTMVFYQIEDEQRDYYSCEVNEQNNSDADQDEEQKKHEYPNAFILSIPTNALTLRQLRQRFPWERVQRVSKVERSQWGMVFKIKQVNQSVDGINIWINLQDDKEKVPLYDGDNMVYVKLIQCKKICQEKKRENNQNIIHIDNSHLNRMKVSD